VESGVVDVSGIAEVGEDAGADDAAVDAADGAAVDADAWGGEACDAWGGEA
jgi:hypothetical protein